MILAGMGCILGVCAGLMAMACAPWLNMPGLFLPAAVFALLCAWLGNSIACVLKANPHDSSPNIKMTEHRGQ